MSTLETIHPPVIELEVPGPEPQRRLTVAFRVILAIPTLLYGGILGTVAFLAVVGIWFAALVTGRAPDGLAEFVGRVVQYLTRINGYAYLLLTDRYPPWDLRADYAISVVLPPRGRLNRAAVLFRLVLLVPAGIVVQLVQYGVMPVLLVIWLIVLVSGKMPRAAWEALVMVLRYEVRFYGFAAMLTSEYPRGLFGDRDGRPTGFAAPPLQEQPLAAPSMPPPTSDAVATFDVGAAPRAGRFVLSKAGKRLLVLMLVLGAVIQVAQIALAGFGSNTGSAAQLEESYDRLSGRTQEISLEIQRCAIDEGGLPCLNGVAGRLAARVEEFRTELHDLQIPSEDLALADRVDEEAAEMSAQLQTMATTDDPATYDQAARAFQDAALRFDQRVGQLYDALLF